MGEVAYKPRLQDLYDQELRTKMAEKFGYKNPMQVPRIEKISINIGVGSEAVQDSKVAQRAADDLALISGQKPVITRAKKSIAGFKVREGMPLGCKVTLRRHRMYEFMDRLVNIALPRVRDFRGLSAKSFNKGNFSVGLKEQIVFPEIDYDKVDKVRGLDITIVTTAKTAEEAKYLMEVFNFPFMK